MQNIKTIAGNGNALVMTTKKWRSCSESKTFHTLISGYDLRSLIILIDYE